jgi:hypothetical protein
MHNSNRISSNHDCQTHLDLSLFCDLGIRPPCSHPWARGVLPIRSGSPTMNATAEPCRMILFSCVCTAHLISVRRLDKPSILLYCLTLAIRSPPFHHRELYNIFDAAKEQKPQGDKNIQVRLRSCSSTPLWTELVFFYSRDEGFHCPLERSCLKATSRSDKLKVFIDGPYGPAHNLDPYDTSVLIASWSLNLLRISLMHVPLSGGSGVSY